MKTIYSFFGVALMLLVQFSCKEDKLDLYNAANVIYFPGNQDVGKVKGREFGHYSFGYVSAFVDHYIQKIPVRATGSIQNYDREYKLKVTDTSTMVEGRDFEFLNKRFFIPANKYADTIFLKVNRSSGLKIKALNVGIELQANENFGLDLSSQIVGTGNDMKLRTLIGYNFSADDIAGAPWFWDTKQTVQANATISFLGPYSNKKFQLMIGRFELDVTPMLEVKYFPSVALMKAWGSGMKAYLNEMQAAGTPVLEENGQPMKVGTSIQ